MWSIPDSSSPHLWSFVSVQEPQRIDLSSKMKYVYRFCFLLGVSLLSVSVSFGQPSGSSDTDASYWAYGGPTATTLGVGASGGIAVEFDRHVLSLRGVSTDQTLGRETWEVAFLYGRAATTENFFLSAGAGTSIVGGMRYPRLFGGGEGEEFEAMIGFPLEGQVAWTPTGVVSLGLYAFANVNTAHPLGGVGLTLRLGDLR